VRISKKEFAELQKRRNLQLSPQKPQKPQKAQEAQQDIASAERYYYDQANIMANWLELYGKIPCISESLYHQMVLDQSYRAHMAVREFHFAAPERLFRADFCWPNLSLILEIDGGLHLAGGGRHNSDKDRDKLNLAALLNYRVVRFSTDRLKVNPTGCVDFILRFMSHI
jgi:very-short-patch-repair endonuclease